MENTTIDDVTIKEEKSNILFILWIVVILWVSVLAYSLGSYGADERVKKITDEKNSVVAWYVQCKTTFQPMQDLIDSKKELEKTDKERENIRKKIIQKKAEVNKIIGNIDE